MLIAALYDIHGNLPALEAVLRDVRHTGVDEIVVGGDIVPGPMPVECLDLLTSSGIPTRFIHGNGERDALAILEGETPTRVPAQFLDVVRWSAEQLGAHHVPLIESWPRTIQISTSI